MSDNSLDECSMPTKELLNYIVNFEYEWEEITIADVEGFFDHWLEHGQE